jgi:hypothetical protein
MKRLPAGYSSDDNFRKGITGPIVFHPVISKTFVKGAIAIAVFSVFLEISPSNFFGYLQFLGLWFVMVSIYAFYKHSSSYSLSEEGIIISRPLKAPVTLKYTSVAGITVTQGFLAKRFGCGSLILSLKEGKGSVKFMVGGMAEMLKDVKDPQWMNEEISSRLSPFGF